MLWLGVRKEDMGDTCALAGSREGYVRALAEVPDFYCSLVDTREHSGRRQRPRNVRHTALQHHVTS